MPIINKNLRKHLNYSFSKSKLAQPDIDNFKVQLNKLLSLVNEAESEEFNKNPLQDFLKDSYYKDKYYINTKGRKDLVIHNDKRANSSVGVIIETKSPTNKAEMVRCDDLNKKSMQELVYYYLQERINHNNLELKHLIITDIKEWFIFDVKIFDKLFFENKNLVKLFDDFERGALAGNKTKNFYTEIAAPAIKEAHDIIEVTYFNLQDYQQSLKMHDFQELLQDPNSDKNDKALIPLFKLLSPIHLLKLSFGNDNNSLNLAFYNELLHIIGLTENKINGKKLIQRKSVEERELGSLLEKTITKIIALKKLKYISDIEQYGEEIEEQLYHIALELNITWINRILFLKLLESQLITYEKDKTEKDYYKFLRKVRCFSDLNDLFFEILAYTKQQRRGMLEQLFEKVPYLNSSLFEPTLLEHQTLVMGNLNTLDEIAIFPATVLKNRDDTQRSGEMETLTYLLGFLDAYDFSSDGTEDLLPTHKELINATTLGLIFEKINGYQDGSFFTPSFITMHMSRETLRRAVVQKFNQVKGWQCKDFNELENKIEGTIEARVEANQIINSLKICDPAVGSGHFLVSVLNELIVIKHDLKLLQDREGKRLKDWHISIENDDLRIVDESGDFFEYNFNSKESQRMQEALFHEKQTLIENCLFGVDINPSSVQICCLRLWIELLKHAYYNHAKPRQLETLPNIDINIHCGNSLVSRFGLDIDLASALVRCEISIHEYQNTFQRYKSATDKDEKSETEHLIRTLNAEFRDELYETYSKVELFKQSHFELVALTQRGYFLRDDFPEKKVEIERLKALIDVLEQEIQAIKDNYNALKAFEWRFEFPEVLTKDGNFEGFDVIIGNPPYIQIQKFSGKKIQTALQNQNYLTFERTGDIYALFIEKAVSLLNSTGFLAFITSNKWMRAGYGESLRHFLAEKTQPLQLIDFSGFQVFDAATVDSNILLLQKQTPNPPPFLACSVSNDYQKGMELARYFANHQQRMPLLSGTQAWVISSAIEQQLKAKIEAKGTPLKDWDISINYGIKTGFNEAFIIDTETKERLCLEDNSSAKIIKKVLRGRDIKKYAAKWAGLWLINLHNNPPVNINNYPAIKKHLDLFYSQLENRLDKGETPYNLRNCAYLKEFEKEKIAYNDICQDLTFAIVEKNVFFNNTVYFISAKFKLNYLTSILNSKLIDWYYRTLSVQLGEKAVRMFSIYVEKIPVPKLSPEEQMPFIKLVDKILAAKKAGKDSSKWETEIDELVYDLYELTDVERQIVKG